MSTRREHFVEFYSPGTFLPETSSRPIPSWDTKIAVDLAKSVVERYYAVPYAFRFLTYLTMDPIPDGEGGALKVKPKEIDRSPLHFIEGSLRTIDEIRKKSDPQERILLSNMVQNKKWIVVENTNSYRTVCVFNEEDFIVSKDGDIIHRGTDHSLVEYRKEKDKLYNTASTET